MKRLKHFLYYVCVQSVTYVVLVYNIRMIAAQNIRLALVSDGVYALLFFTLVRNIAKDKQSREAMMGYLVGSLIGTAIGMVL